MSNDHGCTYAAFISYSHSDENVARWLHRRLEAYEIPPGLRGRPSPLGIVSARLGRFFRDRDELPAATGLTNRIRKALGDSTFLIVLCSPNSARSAWVDREIAEFRALGREDRILAVNIAGEPPATFPPSLAALDLVVADLRETADGREHGFLKLVAGLVGVPLGDVKDREMEATRARARRRQKLIGALTVLLILSLVGLAGTLLYANRSRTLAQEAISISGQIADDAMSLGLNERIPIGAIESFTNTALERLDGLEKQGVDVPELRSRRAWLMVRLAHVAEMKEDVESIERHATRAYALVRGSESYQDLLTSSTALASLATAKSMRGKHAEAVKHSEESVALSRKLARLYPAEYQTRLSLAESLKGLGDERESSGDSVGALAAYWESVALFRRLLHEQPDSGTFPMRMATQLDAIGDIHIGRREPEKALAAYREAVTMAWRFLKVNQTKLSARQKVHASLLKLGDAAAQVAAAPEMIGAYKDALSIAREIAVKHQDYQHADHDLAQTMILLRRAGEMCADAGDESLALAAFESCIEAEEELAARHPDADGLDEQRVVTLLLATGVAVDAADPKRARTHLDRAERLLLSADDWPENERLRNLYKQAYAIRQNYLPGTIITSPSDHPQLPVVHE